MNAKTRLLQDNGLLPAYEKALAPKCAVALAAVAVALGSAGTAVAAHPNPHNFVKPNPHNFRYHADPHNFAVNRNAS